MVFLFQQGFLNFCYGMVRLIESFMAKNHSNYFVFLINFSANLGFTKNKTGNTLSPPDIDLQTPVGDYIMISQKPLLSGPTRRIMPCSCIFLMFLAMFLRSTPIMSAILEVEIYGFSFTKSIIFCDVFCDVSVAFSVTFSVTLGTVMRSVLLYLSDLQRFILVFV